MKKNEMDLLNLHPITLDINIKNTCFKNQQIENKEFVDCKIEGVVFEGVNFISCHFDGVIFKNCLFSHCVISPSDIRGCLFESVTFSKCNLSDSFIDNCYFKDSCIEKSQVKITSITNSSIIKTSLIKLDLTGSSFIHNNLIECFLEELDWESTTFFYVIFRNPILQNVVINDKDLSTVFGLQKDDLKQIKNISILELNKEFDSNRNSVTPRYRLRKLLLSITFKRHSVLSCFSQYIVEIINLSKTDRPITRDELNFIINVMRELANDHKLPFASCLEMLDWANSEVLLLQSTDNKGLSSQRLPIITEFYGSLISLISDLMDRLLTSPINENINSEDRKVLVAFTYLEKPTVETQDIINLATQASGYIIKEKSVSVRFRSGSYIDIIETTLISLAALQMFLFLVNGIVIQLTDLKARVNILKKPKPTKHFNEMARLGKQIIPSHLEEPIKQLYKLTMKLPWVSDPNLNGINGLVEVSEESVVTDKKI